VNNQTMINNNYQKELENKKKIDDNHQGQV
jgi:hypothetical protein